MSRKWHVAPFPDGRRDKHSSMRIARRNRSIRRKLLAMPLCLSHIPHEAPPLRDLNPYEPQALRPLWQLSRLLTVTWLSYDKTGFGLITGFIEPLNNTWLHFTTHCHTQTSVLSHGLHCAAWQRFPTVDVPLLPSSRPCRLAAISHQPPTLLTAVSRVYRNGSWASLYNLGTDRTETPLPTGIQLLRACLLPSNGRVFRAVP
jgi:hypothetical protein